MYNLQDQAGVSGPFSTFALAGLSGAATTHSHAASLPFAINGAFGTSPSGTTTPTVNSSRTAPASVGGSVAAGAALASAAPASGFRAALVVWTIDAAGVKRIRSSGFFESLSSAPIDLPIPGDIPGTEIPVAYHTVKLGTTVSGTWTFGSSNWNATGVTVGAVTNIAGNPVSGVVTQS